MTRIILTCFILTILTGCTTTNLLMYHQREHYKEQCTLTNDTTFSLYQSVCYNRPNSIDEEFCYSLTLTFVDTTAARKKKILDLRKDTAIVKADYDRFSVWDWSDDANKVSGEIELLKWDNDEVTLKENIRVMNHSNREIKKFVGTRTFKRKLP